MNSQTIDSIVAQTLALLNHYGFELKETNAIDLLADWLERYQANWVRLAVIEALYRGRYKAISVEQILNLWEERQHPTYLFGHDFERLICRKLPRNLTAISEAKVTKKQLTKRAKYPLRQDSQIPENHQLDPYWQGEEEYQHTIKSWHTAPVPKEGLSDYETINNDLNSTQWEISDQDVDDFNGEEWEEYMEEKDEDMSNPPIPYRSDWSRVDTGKNPIGQFTPSTSESRFYQKLKAVAQDDD